MVRAMATPRELLAAELKQARLDAGYSSQAALARKLHVSRPMISKAENPSQPVPSDALLVSWAEATRASLDKLRDLAKRARGGTPEWFMPYRIAESEATTLRFWGPLGVPGLLQTEHYARELLAVESYTPERLAELVTARMERQQVLERAFAIAVMDHTVLQRRIGSAEIMAEQCAHLAAMAERPKIRVHIVPEGANVGLWGGFAIAARDGIMTVNLITIRDVTSTAPDLADETMRAFEQILAASMPRRESVDFMRTWEEQWRQRI